MLHYFKFCQELLDPSPAKDIYVKRGPGRGWQEECPPVRAANGFGFDLLANFDLTFIRKGGRWAVAKDLVIESDFAYSGSDESDGQPLVQQYAWFWEKGQKIPHVITDNVFKTLVNQVKVSSFLFLKTDPNELLMMTEIPNMHRPYRAMSAVVDTDWYPASYPWHIMLELDPAQKRIAIKKGDPICRVIPVRRDAYFAKQMEPGDFERFFDRGQAWLKAHGNFPQGGAEHGSGVADITGTYVRQQLRSRFVVIR